MKFTIGTDPEFFLSQGGRYVSAIPHMVGTKRKPQKLECGSTLQRDNVALEFATPPADSEDDFVQKVGATLYEVRRWIPSGSLLQAVPSAHFDRKELQHPEALEIGCEPDFNAWTGERNKPPVGNFKRGTLRSCGAHVHVGHRMLGDRFVKAEMIQLMDYCAGLPSVSLDSDEPAIERRKIYGKSGAYRPTNYGVEYRTLSNFWLKSPDLVRLVYNLTHDALRMLRDNKFIDLIEIIPPVKVRESIDQGLVDTAQECMVKLQQYLSKRSRMLLDKCIVNINDYDISEEWV